MQLWREVAPVLTGGAERLPVGGGRPRPSHRVWGGHNLGGWPKAERTTPASQADTEVWCMGAKPAL